MPKPYTHLLLRVPSQKMDLLYRVSDGMSLGCRIGNTVMEGSDANPASMKTRKFLDETFATMYLRRMAELDANHLTPDQARSKFLPGEELLYFGCSIEERDGESRIVQPNPTLSTARH
jgi:hypothetical protein